MQISTAYGVVLLEAKWLMPANTNPADVAKDPKSCLIAVTIELREHAIAHAARILRESGATPAQLKVGIQLALGKTKRAIADKLGTKLTSVADLGRGPRPYVQPDRPADSGKFGIGEAFCFEALQPFCVGGARSECANIETIPR